MTSPTFSDVPWAEHLNAATARIDARFATLPDTYATLIDVAAQFLALHDIYAGKDDVASQFNTVEDSIATLASNTDTRFAALPTTYATIIDVATRFADLASVYAKSVDVAALFAALPETFTTDAELAVALNALTNLYANKAAVDPFIADTGWQNIAAAANFTAGTLTSTPQVRKRGGQMFLRGAITGNMTANTTTAIGQLPSATFFPPTYAAAQRPICTTGGVVAWAEITSAGVIEARVTATGSHTFVLAGLSGYTTD